MIEMWFGVLVTCLLAALVLFFIPEEEEDTKKQVKTSEEWQEEVKDFCTVLDPDGWDRSPAGWNYSWHEELITKQEFCSRVAVSTIKADIVRLLEWSE